MIRTAPASGSSRRGRRFRRAGYLKVLLNGLNKADLSKNAFAANFKLSLSKQETLVLAKPDGTILDRMPMLSQYGGVSYGRISGKDGFFYLGSQTPGAVNDQTAYVGRVPKVTFGTPGGWITSGTVSLTLSAPEGTTIRYTLDCTEPTESSEAYQEPIEISSNTIVRARAFQEGLLPSLVETQSYLFGEKHTLNVISLVADPTGLFDPAKGLLEMGPKKLKYPYKGANFWQDWERAANLEYFSADGKTILSQGVGLQLQGQYSRMQDQKAFKISARNAYGLNRFHAALFPNRDFTVYKSFILRTSGQDYNKTRFRDALLTSLAAATSVMLPGRPAGGGVPERPVLGPLQHARAVAQVFHRPAHGLDQAGRNRHRQGQRLGGQGSDKTFQQMMDYVDKHGVETDEDLSYVESRIDLQNYLEYIALETFVGNTDLLNIRRYRSDEGDGRWRWIIFDTRLGLLHRYGLLPPLADAWRHGVGQ